MASQRYMFLRLGMLAHSLSLSMALQHDMCLRLGLLARQRLAEDGSNHVFSPASLRVALSMLTTSRYEMLEQGLSFLGAPTVSDLNHTAGKLVRVCNSSIDDSGRRLSIANGIWVDRSVSLQPSFMEAASSVYKAFVKETDFKTQGREVEREVNAWVEKETSGLIKAILPDGSVNHDTIIVLANALYFKASWSHRLSAAGMREFHLADGNSVEAPFMTGDEGMTISSFNGFKALSRSYQLPRSDEEGRRFDMIIYLPDERDGLKDILEQVESHPDFIQNHLPREKFVGDLFLPKFNFSWKFEASTYLEELGLNTMNMKVFHETAIEVDEEGSEAASATAVTYVGCSLDDRPQRPRVDFMVDHPFMFVIRERTSGATLFFGVVTNPLII